MLTGLKIFSIVDTVTATPGPEMLPSRWSAWEVGVEVLVCHRVPEVAAGLAALLLTDPRVHNADFACGVDNVLAAVTNKHYDIQVIGAASVEVCQQAIRTIITENRDVHIPHHRVLIGLNPPAEIISRAVRLGYHAFIDLAADPTNIVDRILSQIETPHQVVTLAETGTPLVSIFHDDIDRVIVERIIDGDSDTEIAEKIHYAVQSVRNRVSRLLKETGARNRTHLAVLFVRAGGVSIRKSGT